MDSDGQLLDDESLFDSADLLDGLLRVSQIVRLRFNDWLGRFELNDGRHAVLVALAREEDGGCSQATLAETLGQSESNVSTLIERMQRDGLVSRSKSDADRRKRILQITPAGRAVLDSVDASRTAWSGRLLSGIRVNDRQQLLFLLKRIGDSLEPSYKDSKLSSAKSVSTTKTEFQSWDDSTNDRDSPQFALRQMLQSLSASGAVVSHEKEVA